MRLVKLAFGILVLWSRFGIRSPNWQAWKTLTVYPKLGVVYNRIRKNANTTTIYLLREIETGEVETRVGAPVRPRNLTSASFVDIWALRTSHFMIVTRNPYSRVLSAFLDKFREAEYQRQYGPFGLTREGFEEFAEWLSSGGLVQNKHWDLQTKHMFLPLSAFDTVVRFENFRSDMFAFLESQSLDAPEGRLDSLYPRDVNKRTSANAKIEEFYTPRTVEIVSSLYARDFEALGYSAAFPAHCQP